MPRAFTGPFPSIEIPDVSLPDFVLQRARSLGDKPALVDGPSGRTITYDQLADSVAAVAAGLVARGLEPGGVVAIFAPNLPEFAAAFHGIARAGGAVTTINSLSSTEEISSQLRATGARFLITVGPFCERALPAAHGAKLDEVFVIGEVPDAPDGTSPTAFASLVADGAAALAGGTNGTVPPTDPASHIVAMPMSSGTTGFPKVVRLTHRNLVANVIQSSHAITIEEDDTLIGILPFFHIYGMTVLVNLALWRGATVVTMPAFDLDGFLTLMEEHRVTLACLVPPIVLALAKHPAVDAHDLSALEYVITGAAPLDGSIADAAASRLDCLVVQGYGLTETSPVLSAPTRDAERARPDTCGLIVPDTEIAIVPLEDDVPEPGVGEDGEIWARGPQVMTGYLDDDGANAWIFPGDGWLRTGDIGHVDADGSLSVVDRLKELIKYRGFQVPPAELEALLVQHPAVADAAVIPSPDPSAGEVPKAFVVRSAGEASAQVTPGELMGWVGERVPSYKKVRRVEFIEEIPRSLSGKILRRVLVEQERGSSGDAVDP